MSIADKLTKLATDINSAYTAIGTKGGTVPEHKNTENLADAIGSISGGGGGAVVEKDVNFYDYDGTLLYSYSFEEAATLTALPDLPTHPEKENFFVDKWTETLNTVVNSKSITNYTQLNVGLECHYYKGDQSEFTFDIEGGESITVYFSQTISEGVTIDFGDESSVVTVSGTGFVNSGSHTYTNSGTYTLTLTPAEGCDITIGHTSSTSTMFGTSSTINLILRKLYLGRCKVQGRFVAYICQELKKVELSNKFTGMSSDSAFTNCYSLRELVIPNSLTGLPSNYIGNGYALNFVTVPSSMASLRTRVFSGSRVKSVIIPTTCNITATSIFENANFLEKCYIPVATSLNNYVSYAYKVKKIFLPQISSVTGSILGSCYSLKTIIFGDVQSIPSNGWIASQNYLEELNFSRCSQVPTISGSSFFSNLKAYTKIIVPDALYNNWIVATNWSTVANKIVKASEYDGGTN